MSEAASPPRVGHLHDRAPIVAADMKPDGAVVEISVSTGPLDRPGSLRRVRIPANDAARGIAEHLNGLPPGGTEQHWTPATFKSDYRKKENWRSSSSLLLSPMTDFASTVRTAWKNATSSRISRGRDRSPRTSS